MISCNSTFHTQVDEMKEKKVPCSHSIFWAPSLSTKPMGSGMSYLNKPLQFSGSESEDGFGFDELR
jgi:hypothetical protein